MSFLDCIQTAVDTGKLGQGKAAEAGDAYQRAIDAGKAEGLGDAAAEVAASHAALKEITSLTNARRWERINEMRKQHDLVQHVNGSKKPTNSLANHSLISTETSLMENIDRTQEAVRNQIMASMAKIVQEFDSKMLGFYKPVDNMNDVVRAIYDGGEGAAKALAEQAKSTYELMRKLLNLEGVSIPENKNFRLNQNHDRYLVRQATKDVWVRDHLADGVLDWSVMQYHGKAIPVTDRAEILGRVWDAITTEGKINIHEAQGNAMSLASRLGRERFLYYANADAWIKMNEKYGQGNFYEQLLHQVESTARNVALMRYLGPNPKVGQAFAERVLEHRVAQDGLAAKSARAAEKLKVAKDRELRSFRDQYTILAREVDTGAGDPLVQTANTARLLTGTAMLGGILATTLSDPFYGMWSRTMYRQWGQAGSLIPRYLQAVVNFKDFKQQILNDAIGMDTVMQMAHANQRYSVELEGSHLAKMLSEANYRITGVSRLTEIGRGLAGQDFAKILARFSDEPFDALPFAEIFRNIGITAADWDQIRQTPHYTPEYYDGTQLLGRGKFLRPIDALNAARGNEARAAANKFMMAQELFIRGGVPGPNVRTRAFVGGAVPASSLYGQLVRSSAQFLLFPASIMFNHWKTAISTPRFSDKAFRLGSLLAFTTAGGALVQQVKELFKGNGPADMTTAKFWGRSFILGGGGAILGDFIYNNVIGANGPFSAQTPMAQEAQKAWALLREPWKAYVLGDESAKPGRAALDFAWSTLPKPQPFRLAIERMIYDPLLEQADPAAYYRKLEAQQQLRDEGQDVWWPSESH